MYSWGLGVSGRLGHGVDHSDGTCPDVGYPRLIESLKVLNVSIFENNSAYSKELVLFRVLDLRMFLHRMRTAVP